MAKNEFREQFLKQYAQQLRTEEKSRATIEKNLRDVRRFGRWLRGQGITKEQVIGYKQQLRPAVRQFHAGIGQSLSALLQSAGLPRPALQDPAGSLRAGRS